MTSIDPALLVFADDGSPACDVAWLWVCNHRWDHWRVEVTTAAEPPFPWRPDPEAERPAHWTPPHPRRAFESSHLGEVTSSLARTDPRAMLDGRQDAELVVVAPHGTSHLHQLVLGSTTDWLLHYSERPVAVIRSAKRTENVLVCDDGGEHARAATEVLARLPWVAETRITVLTVTRDDTAAADRRTVVELLAATGATVEVDDDRRGGPTAAILEAIGELDIDLVVMGTRGLTGWQRIRLGSTAGAVVRLAPCSVLFAHAPQLS